MLANNEIKLIEAHVTSVQLPGQIIKLFGVEWEVTKSGSSYQFKSGTEIYPSTSSVEAALRGINFKIEVDQQMGAISLIEADKASEAVYDQVIQLDGELYSMIDYRNGTYIFIGEDGTQYPSFMNEYKIDIKNVLYQIKPDPFTGDVTLVEDHLESSMVADQVINLRGIDYYVFESLAGKYIFKQPNNVGEIVAGSPTYPSGGSGLNQRVVTIAGKIYDIRERCPFGNCEDERRQDGNEMGN